MVEPLTLTPEVVYPLTLTVSYSALSHSQDCVLCDVPLNMNLNNNHNVAMAVLAPERPDSPVRTEQSMFSPIYGGCCPLL